MHEAYKRLERIFEKITAVITTVLGNSITFIIALVTIIFWLSNRDYKTQDINETIRDVIHSISFLSLIIIQKAFNHFSASLHVKLNELIISHETANNEIINIEKKTELEIVEIQEQYAEILIKEEQLEEKQEELEEKEKELEEKEEKLEKSKTKIGIVFLPPSVF